jgi:hypothetical protein
MIVESFNKGENRPMLLKNPISEPPLPAHKAVSWD